ncbi:MAG: tyrosine-type recombinase/integrase [Desulfomonilaceae bacterium]
MPFWDKRGVWQGLVRWQGRKIKKAFKIKRDAIQWEVETRQELEASLTKKTQIVMALRTFFNRYLDQAKLRFVDKTYDNKKRVTKRVLKRLGNIPVPDVTPDMIESYLLSQAKNGKTARYNEDYKHLKSIFAWGMDVLKMPAENPLTHLKRLPHRRQPQYTPPTEDVLRVLAAAKREETIFLNAYLQTGARKTEIFRWTWAEDINFEQRQVRLTTRKTDDGSEESEWIPMSDTLYEDLWWCWQNRKFKESPYVFVCDRPQHYGKPFKNRRQFVKGLCKRAGVKEFGFHAVRRYVASVLADTYKVSAKTIQRILRHKNLSTTEKYIHNINQDLHAVVNLLSTNGPHMAPIDKKSDPQIT